ncbi:MAG TPA: 6-phosphogluconolactonase, partial [Thermoanaerobaculia bacterium]
DLDPSNAHLPNADAPEQYERDIADAGGLGLTFLGLGRNGHIGFNEPGTSFDARTRVVELTQSTRHANADLFEDGHVPTHAVTMGIATILESRRIVLLVSGSGKEDAIARLRSGEISEEFPASALWKHGDVTVLAT